MCMHGAKTTNQLCDVCDAETAQGEPGWCCEEIDWYKIQEGSS